MTKETNYTDNSGSSPRGRDVAATRQSDGMAIVGEAEYETTGHVRLSTYDTLFLDLYAETRGDYKQIAKELGWTRRRVEYLACKDNIRYEIQEIEKVWRLNRKMKAENAAAKHIELMQKLERDYDELPLEERSKMANPLMKGSETYLKAAGHMSHNNATGSDSQVIINIDLGGDAENEGKVKIDGEKRKK